MRERENRHGSVIISVFCLLLFGVSLVLLFLLLDSRMKCREYEIRIKSLEAEITAFKAGTEETAAAVKTDETINEKVNEQEILTSSIEKTETAPPAVSAALAETEGQTGNVAPPEAAAPASGVDWTNTAAAPGSTGASGTAEATAGSDTAGTEMPLPTVEELEPGTVLDASVVTGREAEMFSVSAIIEGDAVYNRINGKSYRENPNFGLSDLRYLKMIHYNFNHEIQVGEMIVNQGIADDVIHIFRELFDIGYEIQSMYLIDNYWKGDGDSSDSASIEVNNTSAFCYRTATGSGNLSNHAYGRAIDINPQQNPYVWYDGNGSLKWAHANADPYIDRGTGDPHMVVAGDACYNIFIKYGFSWGGEWGNPIDYQHFEKRG